MKKKKNCREFVCLFVLVPWTLSLSLPHSFPLTEDSLLSGWLLGSLLLYRMQLMRRWDTEKTEVNIDPHSKTLIKEGSGKSLLGLSLW